jgi:ribose transport system permease protein
MTSEAEAVGEPAGPSVDRRGSAGPGLLARRRGASALTTYSGLFIWAALIALFALWVPDTFLTTLTVKTLISEQAITAIVAIGLLAPLAAGTFDLSVGSMLGLGVVLMTALSAKWHVALVPSIAITLAVGLAVGAINGALIVGGGISSFIVTLGMSAVLVAPARAISGDQLVSGTGGSLVSLTDRELLGLPIVGLFTLVIAVAVWYVLEHTPIGRRLTATGTGPESARLAGVRTGRLIFGSLLTSAGLATVAGILLASKLGAATSDLGAAYLLPPFAAAFLGTTQLKPGRFNVWGTLLAIFLLATGVKGLQLAGAASWVTDLFNGLALIVAVGLSVWGPQLARMRRGFAGRRPAPVAGSVQ